MAKKYVVKFSYEAAFIAGAIEDFVASNVFGMDTEDSEYEPPYNVGVEEVFNDEAMAREYFATIQSVLTDMGYSYSMADNGNTVVVGEPVNEEYITFDVIQVTTEKVPAWASAYKDSKKEK